MRRSRIYFILVFVLVASALTIYYVHDTKERAWVEDGVLDLSSMAYDYNGTIALNGEWEFYWNQLLTPADFELQKPEPRYAKVPGSWEHDLDGNTYNSKGIATFRMTIENLPEDSRYFGLKKANVRTATRIYVNGELVLEDGKPAVQAQDNIGSNQSKIVYFEIEGRTAEIIIQVANYDYIIGGIAKPVTFGEQQPLMHMHYHQFLFEYTMILIVLIIGLLYLFLFLVSKSFRSREPVALSLALSCLFYGAMSSTYSERVLNLFYPHASINFNFRFGHLMSVLSVIMVLFVINKVNPRYLSNRIRNGMTGIYSTFIVLIFAFPLEMYMPSIAFYLILTIASFLAILLRVVILYFKEPETKSGNLENRTIIFAIFCVILYWFDDSLYSFGIKDNMYLSFLSVAVYSLSLAGLLIARYVSSYRKNEELTEKLIDAFTTLDQTTKEAERHEIAFLQAQIKPHFLFNALNSIISLCYTNGARAAKLLTELSQYLQRSFGVNLSSDFVTIENELKLIEAYVEIEKTRFGDRISVSYDIDEDALPLKITPLVIEPLVENAIRHSVLQLKSGGQVKLSIKKREGMLCICVENNGRGMDARTLAQIQDEESDRISSKGHGISLKNINARLYSFYGVKLDFQTETNGTKVCIEIPAVTDEPLD
ncbi:histidine kinase [Paenibacillus sp. HB172176]|uniref:sensor histidine kinase n=1 Tax=Paenibacillus sp. HB172176 TaxID=2493690 RepID=UPI00143BE9CB|nr:histidine kinase [Paenibacillus sp. HB172176]